MEFLDVQARSPHSDVIEIGCSSGRSVARVLVEAGLNLCAIDASPALPGKYAVRFPAVPVKCKQAERSGPSRR